ncbi:unnamed protein product [Calypogeia fissa]
MDKGKGIAKPEEKVEGQLDDTAKSDFTWYNPVYPHPDHLPDPRRARGNIFFWYKPTFGVPPEEDATQGQYGEASQGQYGKLDNIPCTSAEFKLLAKWNLQDMVWSDNRKMGEKVA